MPIVAHDMFSRFTSVDYLSAAGAAAMVPSRIGNEEAAIIGETHLNGTALDGSLAAGGLAEEESLLGTGVDDIGGSASSIQAPIGDAYYNVGAAIFVLFVIVALGGLFIWRQRKNGGFRRSSILLGSGPGGKAENGLAGHMNQHRRNRSSQSDRHFRHAGLARDEEETGELLAMDRRRSSFTGGRQSRTHSLSGGKQHSRSGSGHSRTGSNHSLSRKGEEEEDPESRPLTQKGTLPKGEELFSVGEEDEEDLSSDEEREREVLGQESPGRSARSGQARRYDI